MRYSRLADLTEYLVPLLKKGMVDNSPYVRKICAIAVLKLYRTSREAAAGVCLLETKYVISGGNESICNVFHLMHLKGVSEARFALRHFEASLTLWKFLCFNHSFGRAVLFCVCMYVNVVSVPSLHSLSCMASITSLFVLHFMVPPASFLGD